MMLSFEPVAEGWADIRFGGLAAADVALRVSYVSDALGDVLAAAAEVCSGLGATAEFIWELEPGLVRGALAREPDDLVRVDLRRSDGRGEPFTVMGAGVWPTIEFASAVVAGCERVDRTQYARLWSLHPFPAGDLARLRQFMINPRRSGPGAVPARIDQEVWAITGPRSPDGRRRDAGRPTR